MDFFWSVLIVCNLWIPVILGYNIVFGKGKIFHFGPVGTWVALSYALFIVMMSTGSYTLGILAAIVTGLVVACVFTWLALRLDADGLGVMSIAVHLSTLAVILNWTDLTRGALGIPGIPWLPFIHSLAMFALLTTAVSLVWIVLFFFVDRSAFARALEALAEHEWHAKSLGISRTRVYLFAFILFSFSAVSSSLFSAQYIHLLHPNDYTFPVFVFTIMIVVAGKPGSLWGYPLSTILLVFLRESIRFIPLEPGILGPMRLLIFGVILLVAVWFRRDSLFPKQRSV